MYRFLFWLGALVAFCGPCVDAQDVVQEFSGSGTTTTGFFKVQGRWEVRWNARQVVSAAVMSSDGTIVAGAAGVLRGSLFVPVGGQYYLKISDGTVAVPPPSTNAPAATPSADDDKTSEAGVSWHLQVIQLGTTVASSDALTVYAPYFAMPDSAIMPPPPEPPPPAITPDQVHALVTIKGATATGIGFLVKSPDGVFIATYLHLLAANANPQFLSNTGALIKTLGIKAASDRDLAFIAVQDDHYSCLPISDGITDVPAVGDQVIIPPIGQPDGTPGKPGKIAIAAADRIDLNGAMDAGSVGAPVIRGGDGMALAMVAAEKRVDVSEDIAKAWAGNPAPGSATIIPFYGLRLDGVKSWETLDWNLFLDQTTLLSQFHQTTRCLDSFLNGLHHRYRWQTNLGSAPDSHYYTNDAKILAATGTYKKFAGGADDQQSLDAARELLSDLEGIADGDVSALQNGSQFYAFERAQVQEELAYRKALRKELDTLGDHISKLDAIARTR